MTRDEQMWEAVEQEHGELSRREAFVTLTALEWADKTIIERVEQWLIKNNRGQTIGSLHRFLEEE